MLAILHLLRSRSGRALRAVATNEIGADAVGIDSFRTKLLFFVLTAGMAGIAGSLYVHINQYASPETFSVSNSILLVVMVALGGSGSFWGPLAGALIYTALPQLLLGLRRRRIDAVRPRHAHRAHRVADGSGRRAGRIAPVSRPSAGRHDRQAAAGRSAQLLLSTDCAPSPI